MQVILNVKNKNPDVASFELIPQTTEEMVKLEIIQGLYIDENNYQFRKSKEISDNLNILSYKFEFKLANKDGK